MDLGALDILATATPTELKAITADSGKMSLMQLGIEHEEGLVNQVNADALDYATERGAEMVGKKWIDGELVDNPDAKWVITDATRDELRGLIAEVQNGTLPMSKLADEIEKAGAFSPERAELIARTETMTANAAGSLAGYKTAASIGIDIRKAWEPDDEACIVCLGNALAGPIPLDRPFPSGHQHPTAHPHCECVLVPVTYAAPATN